MAEASIEQQHPKRTDGNTGKRPSFEVDDRITVRLDPNLAIELGEFILSTGTPNKALYALGHKLKAVEGQYPEQE